MQNGWFTECDDLWPGQRTSLQVDSVLHSEKSKYQDVLVVKTRHHGHALILDGLIQCTESDEFAYQEMISFLPLCSHPQPRNVLIIGGGDGGVVRDVTKHPSVIDIQLVEIDKTVIDVCQRFLPMMAVGFDSDKLSHTHLEDGFEFLQRHQTACFDVIIVDSSDPIGPATKLFTDEFYRLLKGALRSDGIICCQAGTPWSRQLSQVRQTIDMCQKYFACVKYACATVPTYPTGCIGFLLASLTSDHRLEEPKHVFSTQQLNSMRLRYYNQAVHRAAFVLPTFIEHQLFPN